MDNNPKLSKIYRSDMYEPLESDFANISLKEIDRAQEIVDEMKALSTQKGFNSIDVKVKIFTFSSNTQVMVHDRRGDFQKALTTVEEMIAGLDTYKDKLSKEQAILFYYNIAYVYFGVGLHKEALKWLNKLLNDNEQTCVRMFTTVLKFSTLSFTTNWKLRSA